MHAAVPMHEDQVDVDLDTVRRLVDDQLPRWSGLPLRRVDEASTVNAIVRVGGGLSARFPLRGADPDAVLAHVRREHDAAARLHACAPVATPEPVAIGAPGHGYPLAWSVQTWVDGETVTARSHASSEAFALDLAGLVSTLREQETGGRRFDGDGRGGVVAHHDAWVRECLEASRTLLDVDVLASLWDGLRDLPSPTETAMTHGDLVPGNVLARDGRLVGVIDGGGFGPADLALDLVGAWHLLDAGPRGVLRERLGSRDPEWDRGRAWAFEQALGLVAYYLRTNPVMSALGVSTLQRLVDDRHPGRAVAPPSSPVWGLPGAR